MTKIFNDNSYPIEVSFEDPNTGQHFTIQAPAEISFIPGEDDSENFHIQVDFSKLLHAIENVRLAAQLTTSAVLINYADSLENMDDDSLL